LDLDDEELDLGDDELEEEEEDEEDEPAKTGLKEKFSSLMSNLKKKKGKNSEDDDIEIDEDFDEETHSAGKDPKGGAGDHFTDFKYKVEQTINEKVPALAKLLNKNKKDPSSDDSKLEENGEVSAKPKFKLTPIHIVVIIAVVIILLDFGEDEKVPEPKTTKKSRKGPKKKPKKIVETNTESIKKETPKEEPIIETPVEEPPVEASIPEPDTEPEPKSDLEDLKMEDNPEPVIAETEPEEPEAEPENSELEDLTLDTEPQVEPPPAVESTPEPEPMIAESEPEVETEDEGLVEDTSPNSEEIIPQENIETNISTDITRKLLKDLEVRLKAEKRVQKTIDVLKPISAPSYETVGKGLVYNCNGKHWACIEGDEYKKCRQNYSWNRSESIPIECYPVAFLETEFDCNTVQQEKIDSVSETNFCE
jgi:hypothetical protein